VRLDLLVNIDVDDLDAAIRFYGEAFGLTVGRRFGSVGVEMRGASSPIYLLPKRAGTTPAPTVDRPRDYARHWTPVHLDFVVGDLEAAVARALAAGAVIERPLSTSAWGRLAVMADPFGHGFCLVQFIGRGYDELTGAISDDEGA
jgi:predicted enzyme related to lactoylglutathione lyase